MSLTEDDKTWIAELMSHKLEEVETRLLTPFRNLSHPVEARLRAQKIISRGWTSGWTNSRIGVESLEEPRGEPSEAAK